MSPNHSAGGQDARALRDRPAPAQVVPHLYVHEPGWRVSLKRGSHREFCYAQAPGQDYYHRILDGELYLHHGDEKLCLSCACRRGLIEFEPRGLARPIDISLADSAELPTFHPDDDL
ncbi:hypothetical protein OJF2_09770 [Aquisphaera giovannonii]|uniref:Uncharacterized protein n=1 Tax=Aquisphaera giovannonii TaxID=406548 RepID=A0A5B9VY02_9BACT|nr:hypothetical protein [Aquisphaera giovannonii]QEH32500.1 hypothetical protein OJF2_09770 [Aquisphaera giovannonii]